MTLYWAARTGGSAIGSDRDLVDAPAEGKVASRVELACDRANGSVTFTADDAQH